MAVVTDSGVPAQYAQRVADQCKDARIITVPQGEASKSFKILESVLRQMLDFGMGRGDLVVAGRRRGGRPCRFCRFHLYARH